MPAKYHIAHRPDHDGGGKALSFALFQEGSFEHFGEVVHHKVVKRALSAVLFENEAAYFIDTEQASIVFAFHDRNYGRSAGSAVERDQGIHRVVDLHHRISFSYDTAHLGSHILDKGRRHNPKPLKLCLGGIVEAAATNRKIGIVRIDLIL